MPKVIFTLTLLLTLFCGAKAQTFSFSGLTLSPVEETPAASTGLERVYVLPYVTGVTLSYTAADGSAAVTWQRFSALGAAYAEDVPFTRSGAVSTLTALEGDMGYVVTEGTRSHFIWVTDYSRHRLALFDLELSLDSDCGTAWLDVDGSGDKITYYTINGAPVTLHRNLELTYSTLEFDEEAFAYNQTERTDVIADFADKVYCSPPPLCATEFTLSGDRFLRAWGEEESVTSPGYDAVAVEAQTRAVQTEREVENEVKVETELGGSGPCDIRFSAVVTDAAIFHEWQISSDSQFNIINLSFSDLEFEHTFRSQGTTYVRLVCADASGDCEYISDVYQVFIGESLLQCPNAFSPGTSEGVNDEWRVSYKSIIEFDCHIFDRYGRQLAHLTSPDQGWDGKQGGRTVGAGVYFYVIKALGADGHKYNLSGDINVVGFQKRTVNESQGL